MKYIKSILCCTLLLLSVKTDLAAAHIVGGDIVYKFVEFSENETMVTFQITVTMYRDDNGLGADFDDATETAFGVFRKNSVGAWNLYEQVRGVGPRGVEAIEPNDLECVEPTVEIKVERGFYQFEVTLEVGDTDYMIAYQRCCRNMTIANIINPGDTGAAFDVIITPEAQRTGNNSPVFDSFPPIFICAGFEVEGVEQSGTDAEGDELRYSFCSPFTAGGIVDAVGAGAGTLGCCDCVRPLPQLCRPPFNTVDFEPPYGPTNPLGGAPEVTIDPLTGVISGIPTVEGQFVVGVCIEEYRNGVLIGRIRRDFQFNVIPCEVSVFARLDADEVVPAQVPATASSGNTNLYKYKLCGELDLDINNLSSEIRFINDYEWQIVDDNSNVIYEAEGGTEKDASVIFPDFGKYYGNMILNKGRMCSDTAPFEIDVFPGLDAGYSFMYDTCVAGATDFIDSSSTGGMNLVAWNWRFDEDGTSTDQNPKFEFPTPGRKIVQLLVEDNNGCLDSIEQTVQYFPAPNSVELEPTTFIGCNPLDIFLDNLSFPIDSTYDVFWDFGDENTSREISPNHTYLEPGNYNVSVEIISPLNCAISRSFDDYILVKQSPVAGFTCDPPTANIFNKKITFTDQSIDAGRWQWDFGGDGFSFEQDPVHEFQDTGFYKVTLTVLHPTSNCPDTISKLIDVTPTVDFFFPNAFTPNNDASNDEFLGMGYYGGILDYQLLIFNRWGQKVFESSNPREAWNGQEFNQGKAAPQGVYVYKATYRDPRGRRFDTDGHVTLLR